MNFMVWLFLSKAAELNLEVTKAPQVLDFEKLKSWVNGTVWCLLALNAISLAFYLGALVYPSLARFFMVVASWFKRKHHEEHVETRVNSQPEATVVANPGESEIPINVTPPSHVIESNIPANELKTPSNPTGEIDKAAVTEVESVLDIPKIESITAPPVEVPTPIPAPEPQEAAPPPVAEPPPPPPPVEENPFQEKTEVTEILNVKEKEAIEAQQVPLPEAPDFDQKEGKMEDSATPIPDPLPALAALEDSLFSDADTASDSNEASIFDPTTLDQALNDSSEKASEDKKV